jgi:hypothetical protein
MNRYILYVIDGLFGHQRNICPESDTRGVEDNDRFSDSSDLL